MKMPQHSKKKTKYMSKGGTMNKKTKYMSKGGPVTDQQQMAMGNGSKTIKK